MGLDNYFTRPIQEKDNLVRFYKAQKEMLYLANEDNSFLDHTEDEDLFIQNMGFRLEPANPRINLVLKGGGFSSGENGTFRGKFYSTLCDALLSGYRDDDTHGIVHDWLYRNHFKHEIDQAYKIIATHQQKLIQDSTYWETFKKDYLAKADNYFGFAEDYTLQIVLDFCAFIGDYATMDDDTIFLNAWY